MGPDGFCAHSSRMGLSARAKELKNLLSLAVKLRQLANDDRSAVRGTLRVVR